jgi:Tfp pilus assembly protein PilW
MSKYRLRRKSGESGFSLVELLVVCVILVLILGIIAVTVTGIQSSYDERRRRSEELTDGAAALDLLTRVIRVAGANTNQQALTPNGSSQLRIRADWNPVDSTFNGDFEDVTFFLSNNSLFMKNETTNVPTELTTNVNFLKFEYFDSNGAATTDPAKIAVVKTTLTIGNGSSPRTFTSKTVVRKGLQIKGN